MATWFDGAEVFVEFAPGDAPLTAVASCTWVDITASVRSIELRRGRSSELSSVSPGTATILLDNRARLFDPDNTGGTYVGELLPMKRIRVRAVIGATSAVLFTGYMLGFPQEYPGMVDQVVSVQCVDGFRVLEQSSLPGSAYAAEVLADDPDNYWLMQSLDEASSIVPVRGAIDLLSIEPWVAGSGTVDVSTSGTLPVGESNGLIDGRNFSPTVGTFPAVVEMWVDPAADVTNTVQIRFAESTSDFFVVRPAANNYQSVVVNYSHGGKKDSVADGPLGVWFTLPTAAPTEPYHVAVVASSTTLTVYVNGAVIGTDTLASGSYTITFSGQVPGISTIFADLTAVSHLATYSTAPSAARILAHATAGITGYGHPHGERTGARVGRCLDAIGWPSGDRDLATGETVCGPWLPDSDSALGHIRQLEVAEQGVVFMAGDGKVTLRDRQWFMTNTRNVTVQATFGDGAGELPYRDVSISSRESDYIRNVVSVAYSGGRVAEQDATSVAAYTEQGDSVSARTIRKANIARNLARYRLRLRKDPVTRVNRLTVDPRAGAGTATVLPELITLDLCDRVAVKRRPTGGTGTIDLIASVQGVSHVITPGRWSVDFYLAPAPPNCTEGPYLTLGDSTYGDIGAAAGNLIPY